MRTLLVALWCAGLLAACAPARPAPPSTAPLEAPLTVVHMAPTGRPLAKPPFRYMHYYRTEVHNRSDRPMKIVWFEGFSRAGDAWRPGNVLGRTLRGKTFAAWYTEGDAAPSGVIAPGATAV